MSTTNELSILAKAVYSLVSTDSSYVATVGKRFYEQVVPEGATLPAGVMVHMGGNDINGGFGQRLGCSGMYQVKGVCQGDSFAPLEGVCDDLDRILCAVRQYPYSAVDAGGNTRSIIITGIQRKDVLKMTEDQEGVRLNHMGGLYYIAYYDSR